jgi:hypothetical protein
MPETTARPVCACGDEETGEEILLQTNGTYAVLCDECYSSDMSSFCDVCGTLAECTYPADPDNGEDSSVCGFCIALGLAGPIPDVLANIDSLDYTADDALQVNIRAREEWNQMTAAGCTAAEADVAIWLAHQMRTDPVGMAALTAGQAAG